MGKGKVTVMITVFSHPRSPFIYGVTFRPLSADDFQAYKMLRLNALLSEDRRYFVETGKPERLRSDDEWRKACAETFDQNGRGQSVAIGAFCRTKHRCQLIGSALTERWDQDKEGKTAFYRAIYVHPSFRNIGIAENIEYLQDRWAIKHGYSRSILTVRADKTGWLQRQIDVFGAAIVGTSVLPYANGETAQTHTLERPLKKARAYALPKPPAYVRAG